MTINTPFRWWYYILLLELMLPTCVQNLTTLGLAVPVIWLEPPKFKMGQMTWPRLYQGRFVVRRLRLAHLTSTSNLESLRSPVMKMHKATQNVEIEVVLRWLGVTQGQWHRVHTTWTSYSCLIEIMKLTCTVFEILLFIFQKLKRSRDNDHAPFRDNLSSIGWDLLWSMCTRNLKSLA